MGLKTFVFVFCTLLMGYAPIGFADHYHIDNKGAHAFIQFRIKHLGISWLFGRFNTFAGTFEYYETDPSAAKVVVDIDVASIDSNHAE